MNKKLFMIFSSLFIALSPCITVNPFDKSVFTSFANSGIFGKWFDKLAFSGIANDGIFAKWSDKILCGTLNLFGCQQKQGYLEISAIDGWAMPTLHILFGFYNLCLSVSNFGH